MSQEVNRAGSVLSSTGVFSRRRSVFATLALGMAISPLLAASANAQVSSNWTGAVNQNWNEAGNWSNGFPSGAFPDGVATINTATGNYPIVNADPVFTPSDIVIGDGAGSTGLLEQTGGNLATGTGNWFFVGREGGTGTYNLTGGTLAAQDIHLARTGTTATGTMNVTNATVNAAGVVVVADGLNGTAGAVGTMNVNAGGTLNSENDLLVAFAGGASTVGELNIATGATVNVATTTKRWLIMNMWDLTQGRMNINGGTLNLNANTDLRFSTGNFAPGASAGPSVVNLNSGSINAYSGNQTGAGAGVVDLNNNASRAEVNNTFNLNGGTLSVRQVITNNNNGTATFNFNGGTLKATGNTTQFVDLGGATQTAKVQNGGAIIDTNGFDVTVPQPLIAGGTGGLTKNGAGTLTVSGASTYTGATVINGGTLRLASGGPPQAVGRYSFDELADGTLTAGAAVLNTGTGGVALNGVANHNDNLLDPFNGDTNVTTGHTGKGLAFGGFGSSVDVADKIVDQGGGSSWTFSAWINTTTQGSSIISKDDGGNTWNSGDSVFYLGSNPISGTPGSLPTAVRNSGGFMQGDPTPVSLTDGAWHMVTFVSTAGTKQIYVDGVALPMTYTDFNLGDTATKTRLGFNIDALANLDGNVNFTGTMDELQFFDQSLNSAQIQSLFTSNTVTTGVGSQQYLPAATAVSIPVSGATLDLNNNTQAIGSLAGVTGSAVTLGTGTLITGGNNTSTSFAGVISGTGGFTKTGTGTQTLSGANTYTGTTAVEGGVLTLSSAASGTVLGNASVTTPGGADIRGGKLVLQYTGTSPATQVRTVLDAGFDQAVKFQNGLIRSTTLAGNRTLGWRDTGTAVEVAYTLAGDADLTFAVNFDDLLLLAKNFNGANKVWGQGDFNYDTAVNFDDLLLLAKNFNQSVTASQSAQLGESFMADFALAQSMVPEPASLSLLGLGAAAMLRRRRA